MKSSDTQN